MHSKTPGRVRRQLAVALQRDFPFLGKLPITWLPENLFPARGAHRKFCDTYRWSGAPIFTDTRNHAGLFDSWRTMTACVAAKKLVLIDGEIELAN
jgi:hypothetical protein